MSELETELVNALRGWLYYAEEYLSEFDIEGDPTCDAETLCPRCRLAGCIQLKIRNAQAAINKAEGR